MSTPGDVAPDGEEVLERARAWASEDPDPATRAELEREIAREDLHQLAARFREPLHFGTAGIRGELGAGPAMMNLAIVRRVSAAFAQELASEQLGGPVSVVIGRDARHGSEQFAAQAAAVLSGAGIDVLQLPEPVPTPVLAFAVRDLGCAGGLMVTASHNPPSENGLKVYTSGGEQIAPPLDRRIAARMGSLSGTAELPLGDGGKLLDASVLERYIEQVAALPTSSPAAAGERRPRIFYTPLHGVGARTLCAAFEAAGYDSPRIFAPQARPDPDFPTLQRPNPEEPDALASAIAQAAADSYDLLLANDPDADRLAVAIPSREGGWRTLTGDELGVLLAEHVVRRRASARGLLVTTVASSTMLERLASEHGVGFAQTLTGFKWIVRAAGALGERAGLLFGYEEALGYSVSEMVRDKDGISAALAVAACAEDAALAGLTLEDRLDELAARHGVHATRQLSVGLPKGVAGAAAREAMTALRERPPRELAGAPVDWSEDLLQAEPDGAGTAADRARVPGLPGADVLVFGCGERLRIVVRPSGSEPRLKVYLQSVQDAGSDLGAARARATRELERLELEVRALLTGESPVGVA